MDIQIFPPEELIDVTIDLPLSKSVFNRLLIMEALAGKPVRPIPSGSSDDVNALINGLNYRYNDSINVGAAGTTMRFLTAFYAVTPNVDIIIDGSDRMRKRPIAPLVDALNSLGAEISYVDEEGYPPLHIQGKELEGGTVDLKASVSSQFITALMLVAPYMTNGLTINLEGNVVSGSYIHLTKKLQQRCGIDTEIEDLQIRIPHGNYLITQDILEKDWTSASYWAQIVALSAGFVNLTGLSVANDCQGDKNIIHFFEPLGVSISQDEASEIVEMCAHPDLNGHLELDLSDNPDLGQTLAVTCCLLRIPFQFTGLSTLVIKETNRIEALKNELLKFGCIVESPNNDSLSWDGRIFPIQDVPAIDTYEDHRMALSFAPAALYFPGLIINDSEVVTKSYPTFWDDLKKAGFEINPIEYRHSKEETAYN